MFEYLFIINQKDQFIKMIKTDLYSNPIVNLIYQVFYGKGRIIKERMLNLLQLNNIDNDITDKEVTKLLTLLNKYNIVKYNNKNNYFIVIESDQLQPQINGAYIEPSLPFSNIYNMRKVLRGCTGDIYWIDKHFRKEGLEIICDSFLTSGVNSITIISSDENKTQTAIADFKNLEIELNSRGIKIEWLIIEDKNFKWHDRWIISQNCYYNIPPVLAIVRGQRSEIIKTNNMVDLPNFLKNTAYKVT